MENELLGHFRTTKWLDSAAACAFWFGWFQGKGIPVAILKSEEQARPKYAVARAGVESWGEGTDESESNKMDDQLVTVMRKDNGFVLIWKKENSKTWHLPEPARALILSPASSSSSASLH